jgi:hypothetical protein
MRKYLKLWFALVMAYLLGYGLPIVAAVYLFASEIPSKEYGGLVFYTVMAIILLFVLLRMRTVVKKMKMGATKVLIQSAAALIVVFGLYQFLNYVSINTLLLSQQLLSVLGGVVLSFPFKVWAIKIDAEFIERVGLL